MASKLGDEARKGKKQIVVHNMHFDCMGMGCDQGSQPPGADPLSAKQREEIKCVS